MRLAAVVLIAESRRRHKLFFVPLVQCLAAQCQPVVDIITEMECADYVVAEAARAEILHADGHTVGIVVEQVLEVLAGPLVDDEHRLPLRLFLLFLRSGSRSLISMWYLRASHLSASG